ncbi:hypothetical protein AVEN_59967-1 [Araneus ventricosus]|uniref:Uncharacterized protein n=1 Tax=Araneus ventricosus TaxID=182803 RepID=A0A4Y2TJZ8_ARAVE|nr:hypothetical protein AVEN_59967-1 [Araneus ventricosus]
MFTSIPIPQKLLKISLRIVPQKAQGLVSRPQKKKLRSYSHANSEDGGENKHTGRDIEDSWLSSKEFDDSDMDKDYVPNSDARLKNNYLSRADGDKLIAEYDLHLTGSKIKVHNMEQEDFKQFNSFFTG